MRTTIGTQMTRMYVMDKLEKAIGANFLNWAKEYFAEDNRNLDRMIPLKEVITSLRNKTGEGMPPSMLYYYLTIFAIWAPWIEEINPKDMRSAKVNFYNVIFKKSNYKIIEYIYVKRKEVQS